MIISPLPVTDTLSNLNDQIANGARLIGRSKHRQAIFAFVYKGKKQVKSIKEIMSATGMSQIHVLNECQKMAGFLLEKVSGGYKKKKELLTLHKKILSLARNKKKLKDFPTKVSPLNNKSTQIINFTLASAQNAKHITIDQIDSFSKIKLIKREKVGINKPIKERRIKGAFKKIIGETGCFKDWGGERSDLFSTRVRLGGKRIATAIAFKGGGTRGKLVPAKMGKNGDQISRLFNEPAQLFIVVYWGQIESSVIEQMKAFAVFKAISGQKVYYAIMDGEDIRRLALAYPKYF